MESSINSLFREAPELERGFHALLIGDLVNEETVRMLPQQNMINALHGSARIQGCIGALCTAPQGGKSSLVKQH